MQLQPMVMNALLQDPAMDTQPMQAITGTYDRIGDTASFHFLKRIEEIGLAQDKRIAGDLRAYAKSRSQTAQWAVLLRLQYDTDDMQFHTTLAKNLAGQLSQALTTLTQRA